MARHQFLLIRRLATILRRGMTRSGHIAQVEYHEHRGNCLPPSRGCTPACIEAQELVALTEPYMPTKKPKQPRPIKAVPMIVLARPKRAKRHGQPEQPSLFGDRPREEVAG